MHRTNLKGVNFGSSTSKTRKPCVVGSPDCCSFFFFFFFFLLTGVSGCAWHRDAFLVRLSLGYKVLLTDRLNMTTKQIKKVRNSFQTKSCRDEARSSHNVSFALKEKSLLLDFSSLDRSRG